jgi:hypothetical protein
MVLTAFARQITSFHISYPVRHSEFAVVVA